ncbi:MAG TPA: alpha/beta hydrolase family protein [Polyangiaceae bacterium]|jgi:pimeloyl-ACP methyl ester carboxylesterase
MPSVGRGVDRIVGGLTHLLHLRAAQQNTVDDLGPYLDQPPAVLFPAPAAPRDVLRHRSRIPRSGGRVVETLSWHSQHVPLCPHYRARHAGEYARNQMVSARFWHPRSGLRKKALVYVHGWLEPGPWVEEAVLLPRFYEELGVDVLHVQLPFHGSRNPKSALFHGEFFWSADLVRSMEAVRQSCIDARTLVAWLRGQGYDEIGVTGISLGGSITMVLACVEPTPDYIVPIVSHLHLAEAVEEAPILWRMKADLEKFGVGRERRREIFRRIGLESMLPVLPAERQLWIMARDDVYIAAPLVEAQWHAWGEPPIEWIPGGHMTFPLSLGRIVERTREFHAGLPR